MTFMNMNKIKTIALSIAGMALALSCSESIDVPLVDEGGYKTLENNLASSPISMDVAMLTLSFSMRMGQ